MVDIKDYDEDVGIFEIQENIDRQDDRIGLAIPQISTVENAPNAVFSVKLTLACGTCFLTGIDGRYELSLRQCNVHINTNNCIADFNSAYSYQLPDEIVNSNITASKSDNYTENKNLKAVLNAESKLTKTISATLSGAIGRSKDKSITHDQNLKAKKRVMLVSFSGTYWTVGDSEHGDPKNYNGRLHERYFNEDKDKNLCKINVEKGVKEASVIIEVRARFGQLDIDVVDDMDRPINKISSVNRDDVTIALKRKISGIAFAKAFREQHAEECEALPPSEFVLSRRTIKVFMPKSYSEGLSKKTNARPKPRNKEKINDCFK